MDMDTHSDMPGHTFRYTWAHIQIQIHVDIHSDTHRHTFRYTYTDIHQDMSGLGLNRVLNFAEYRVYEAVFAEYRYRVFDKV